MQPADLGQGARGMRLPQREAEAVSGRGLVRQYRQRPMDQTGPGFQPAVGGSVVRHTDMMQTPYRQSDNRQKHQREQRDMQPHLGFEDVDLTGVDHFQAKARLDGIRQALFGPGSLGLDSVDALQLVVALDKHYGLKIPTPAHAKETFQSVNTIAAAILAKPPLPEAI